MRAFADGCSAMTGTEAVSNGTPAFQPPEWRNAHTTMVTMAGLLGVVFLGMSFLARGHGGGALQHRVGPLQVGRAMLGQGAPLLHPPVLHDGHPGAGGPDELRRLPAPCLDPGARWLLPARVRLPGRASRVQRRDRGPGGRLDRRGGRVRRRVEALIPLYAIGVFTAFTLSQAGMVRHWSSGSGPGWRRSALVNGVGAVATGVVAVVFAVAKFGLGAWVVLVIVPMLVVAMLLVRAWYARGRLSSAGRPGHRLGSAGPRSAW